MLDPVKPSEFMMPKHVSTSANITRKQRIPFLPNAQVTYSPDSNGVIEFDIYDPTSFALYQESYFVFDIYRSDGVSNYDWNAYFDCGGFDACVRNYEIYARSSNTRIHQLQSYNRMYAMMRKYHIDKTSMDMFYNKRGDSEPFKQLEYRQHSFRIQATSVTYANTGDVTLTFTTDDVSHYLNVGDLVIVHSATVAFHATVQSLSYVHPTLTLALKSGNALDGTNRITSADELCIYKLHNTETFQSTRINNSGVEDGKANLGLTALKYLPERFRMARLTGEGNRVRVIWSPFSAAHTKSWPLFTIKMGLRHRIELERGGRALVTGLNPAQSTTEPTYAIQNPRFVVMLSSPDASIAKETIAQWNSPMGLLYYVPSYKYREVNQANAGSTNTTLNLHYGVRSAKGLAITINDEVISNGNNSLQYASESLSTNLRDGITYYQVSVGANQYPQTRAELINPGVTSIRDFDMNENLNDIYYWTFIKNPSVFKENYKETQFIYTAAADITKTGLPVSKDFVLYRNFSRSITADNLLCGLDVSQAPVQVTIERQIPHSDYGFSGNVVYRSYLFHDAFIRIGSQITTTLE